MEQNYNDIMSHQGYDINVCDIFVDWENVKDEILLPERKAGSGNGTIHVFLGAADNELRKEFSSYYHRVEDGEDTSIGAVEVKHYFLASNIISMLGYVCKYLHDKNESMTPFLLKALNNLKDFPEEDGLLQTKSLFKLSIGSNKLRPYFKQFDSEGVFSKLIRQILLPNSSYKISLYKNKQGEYAAFWLIGFDWQNTFEADSSISNLNKPKAISLDTINISRQQIYYGAPGTGKSHVINDMTQGEDVIRTTFHPDSDYSTFVGAYKPTTKEVVMRDLSGHPIYEGDKELYEDKIVYEFVDQAFLQAYVKAWKNFAEAEDGGEPKKQFLVIEEINRGNCAQIFGDLFQLLDRNDYGFSDYPIQADKDMKKQLAKAFSGLEIASADRINAIYNKDVVSKVLSGEELLLPSNLYIWATMNTSDQSLFPIDSAFKRRWDWQYMPISKGHDDKTGAEINWRIQGKTKEYDWWSFLEKINEHIDSTTHSEDKKLGFFFCKAKDNVISSETFVGKVIFYLWNDVFKDYGFDDSIFDDVNGSKLSFNKFYSTDSKGMTVVQKGKVERFLDNLGVAIAGEIDDEEFIDSDSDDNVDKNIDDNVDYNNQGGGNDYSKFSINGSGQYNKGAVAYEAIKMYCDNNPTMSAEDVVAKWLALNVKMPNLVETEAVHEQRRQKGNDPSFDRRSNVLVLKDGTRIFVSTQFTKSRINDLISKVNSQNWGITIAKV